MNSKLAALGAFLAGGVLVGGITFEGVAHGASTASTSGSGISDAQYTAKNAWVQSLQETAGNTTTATLSIPAGKRLTITSALAGTEGSSYNCTISASVNGVTVAYDIGTVVLSENVGDILPIYADSGTVTCPAGDTPGSITLVGYLTPIPAG